jgi:hypothetical protein
VGRDGAGRTTIQLAIDRRVLNRLSIFAADAVEREPNGGRGFSGPDPEGHLWNFGTYDPWKR